MGTMATQSLWIVFPQRHYVEITVETNRYLRASILTLILAAGSLTREDVVTGDREDEGLTSLQTSGGDIAAGHTGCSFHQPLQEQPPQSQQAVFSESSTSRTFSSSCCQS